MSCHGITIMSGVIGLLFAVVFLSDIFTPLGLPLFVFYVVPLALSWRLRRRRVPYWLAGASSLATVSSYFLSPSVGDVPAWLPIINRGIGVALFWLTAAVIRRQQDMADHLVRVAALEAENHAHLMKEQALQRQAEEIQDLYNHAPCGYHSLDASGLYIEINDTELNWLGYQREEIVGEKRFVDLLTPRSAGRFQNAAARLAARGFLHDLELDLMRKDGTILPISLSATTIKDSEHRYIASRSTIVDITERRRTEEVLRQAHDALEAQVRERTAELAVANRRLEEQLEESRRTEEALRQKTLLIELSHEPILAWTTQGDIIEWNRGCEQLYGFTRTEALGRRCHDLLHTVFPEPSEEIMAKATRTGTWTGELLQRTKHQREVIVESRWACIAQGDRHVILEADRDITERKKAETILIKKNKDLETLLYVTSHDLKEPLRAIEGFSQLVLERYAERLDAVGGDYLRRVVRATQRLDRLLTDILELSRAQRMQPPMEDVDADLLVKEALTRLDKRIRETGAAIQIVSPLPKLRVNRTWATQGLYNLLANALKFTRDGEAPNIEIASYQDPEFGVSFAGVVVRDRGPGVPPRHADRIFQLFQRAVGRDVEGTGAGLAIVRQVAERHGGQAWVRPRAGGGSEFVITFACPTHGHNGGALRP